MRNNSILAAAHYSALAQFAFWMDEHLRQFPWTSEVQVNGTLHPGLVNERSKDITQNMRWNRHTIGELTSGGRLIASQENPSLHSEVQCDFPMPSKFVSDTKRAVLPYQTTTEKESLSGTLKSGTETIGQCIKIMRISFKEFTFDFECYGW